MLATAVEKRKTKVRAVLEPLRLKGFKVGSD